MSPESKRWVLVARILKPRGNKGEVAAEILTDFPERLTNRSELFLGGIGGPKAEPRAVAVKSCWLSQNHKGQIVFHFEGCDSITEAERLRGGDVLLPFEQRVTLPAEQYFVSDLIGCSVFENPAAPPSMASSPCFLAEAPTLLGTVRDVQFPGEETSGTPILEVDTARGEVLIPLAVDICTKIDTAARRIEVVLPEGLSDLNQK